MAENKKLADEQAEKVTGGNWFSNLWKKVVDGDSDGNAIYGSKDTTLNMMDIIDESMDTDIIDESMDTDIIDESFITDDTIKF